MSTNSKSKTSKSTATKTVAPVEVEKKQSKPIVATEINPLQIVTVVNGFNGKLIYISPKTGEEYRWDEFGAEQEFELRELRNVKSSAKAFFENNWFMFKEEDSWVIDYLGVKQFYANSIPVDKFDDVLKLPAEKIKTGLAKVPDGQKKSLAYRAIELIKSGEIDSRKSIAALEEYLGVRLIEE